MTDFGKSTELRPFNGLRAKLFHPGAYPVKRSRRGRKSWALTPKPARGVRA
jgi:hypothetical protein